MINNTDLQFDEPTHTYKVKGETYTSATTFIKQFFPEFNAPKKAEELSYSYGKYKNQSKQEILNSWRQIANDGTKIHAEIEDYINQEKDLGSISLKAARGAMFWEHIQTEYDVLSVEPELRVYDPDHLIAGTIDVAFKHVCPEGRLRPRVSLIDWKTNKSIYKKPYNKGETGTHKHTEKIPNSKYHKYMLQLSLYAYILEECFNQKIYKLYLVHVKTDKEKVYDVPYKKHVIQKLLNTRCKPKH